MSFIKYIEKNGPPDCLTFSYSDKECYGIWGFDDIISIDINHSENPINEFQKKIDVWKKDSDELAAVGYFSYDAKQIFYPHIKFKNLKSEIPVIWFAKPRIVKKFSRQEIKKTYTGGIHSLKKTKDLNDINHYNNKIDIIKTYLKSGDVYQINYTQPMEYQSDIVSPFDLYCDLFKSENPNFGMYLDMGLFQILSMSPENFFTKVNHHISSYPIKGTRKKVSNMNEDVQLRNELKKSSKDRAEHLMIVDLIRNDLGKICKFGSIKTKNLFKVHSFKTIHHMITGISGKIKNNINESDVFDALFPGGSITGAPKESAMKIIDDIEEYSREIYTGALGIISSNSDMIFNLGIRTLTLIDNKIIYPVGGGIVWDSNAQDERNEALCKSQILNR